MKESASARAEDGDLRVRQCPVLPFNYTCAIFAIFCLSMVQSFGQSGSGTQHCSYAYRSFTLTIRGRNVSVDSYIPTEMTKGLVIVLHGSLGPLNRKTDPAPQNDSVGEYHLADACYSIALPHYFDLVSPGPISKESVVEALPDIESLIIRLQQLLSVGPFNRTYLYGESLGGYIGIYIAGHLRGIDGVSVAATGWQTEVAEAPLNKVFPPLLISYGQNDRLVHLSDIGHLRQFWREHYGRTDLEVYPQRSHYITVSDKARLASRTIEFFDSLQPNSGIGNHESGSQVFRPRTDQSLRQKGELLVKQVSPLPTVNTSLDSITKILRQFGLDDDLIQSLPELSFIVKFQDEMAQRRQKGASEAEIAASISKALRSSEINLPYVGEETIQSIRALVLPQYGVGPRLNLEGHPTIVRMNESLTPIEIIGVIGVILRKSDQNQNRAKLCGRDIREILDSVFIDIGILPATIPDCDSSCAGFTAK